MSICTELIAMPSSISYPATWYTSNRIEHRKRKIYVLLTRFPNLGSKIISKITSFYYTHASIGLEDDLNTFYSFVTKGFIVEKIDRYIRPDRDPYPCMLYEIEVTNEVYEKIKSIINVFIIEKKNLRYTKLGFALCLFRVSYQKQNRFFCSQFVAYVLKYSGAVCFQKDSSLFLPKDFSRMNEAKYVFSGNMASLLVKA